MHRKSAYILRILATKHFIMLADTLNEIKISRPLKPQMGKCIKYNDVKSVVYKQK